MNDLLLECAHLNESHVERIAELEDELKSLQEKYTEKCIFAEQLRVRTLRDHDKIAELQAKVAKMFGELNYAELRIQDLRARHGS